MNKTQKYIVLVVLFIVPLVFYVLISTGIHNFAKLPILTKKVQDISTLDTSSTFKEKVSVIIFLGNDIQSIKGGIFNLNQEIYKTFLGFKDFQMIGVYPKGKEEEIQKLKKELGSFTDMSKWKFIAVTPLKIKSFFNNFKTPLQLNNQLFNANAFIIDKTINLRGRNDDENTKNGKLYGYNTHQVAVLKNKMIDDIKIILAEYRFAFKKNDKK